MARVEDFLADSRERALGLLEEASRRGDADAFRRAGPAGKRERQRFEVSVHHGAAQVLRQAESALRELTVGGRHAVQGISRHLEGVHEASRGVPEPGQKAPVHSGLVAIARDFGAVRDIAATASLSRDERVRIRDHIATTSSHVARVAAGTITGSRLGPRVEGYEQAAIALEASRSRNFPQGLGQAGLAGVPGGTDLEQSVSNWVSASKEALRPDRMSSLAPNARLIAARASVLSAACQRAALAQGGPDARGIADAWRRQALAWKEAAYSWRPPPRLVSGQGSPDSIRVADDRLGTVIAREFRDVRGRWVPPERLADPATLRRFEFDARKALSELGNQYVEAVQAAARSDRLMMPAAQLQRPVEGYSSPVVRLHQHRDWIPLRETQPAARGLVARAGEARRTAIEVNRVVDAGDGRRSHVEAAFPRRTIGGPRPGAAASAARSFQQRTGSPQRGRDKGGPAL